MLDGLGDSGGQQPDHLCHRVWLKRTKNTPELSHLHLGDVRLNTAKVPTKDGDANASPAAVEHGILRRTQGHSSAMLIHESRILQVTIFGTLYNNLSLLNFNLLLPDVMTIADEVDSQLTQTMESFTNPPKSPKVQLVKPKGRVPAEGVASQT